MAGHDDRDRVGAVGETDGADSFRITDALRQIEIADRFPVRDPAELRPDLGLEWRSADPQPRLEDPQFAREILVELAANTVEQPFSIGLPPRVDGGSPQARREREDVKTVAIAGENQRAGRAVVDG